MSGVFVWRWMRVLEFETRWSFKSQVHRVDEEAAADGGTREWHSFQSWDWQPSVAQHVRKPSGTSNVAYVPIENSASAVFTLYAIGCWTRGQGPASVGRSYLIPRLPEFEPRHGQAPPRP